ncbi:MAG: PRC-barrel domain-containing protein [Candidatus Aenigmarchaeota archaeon]|nr:PRC-barrel domain-containing protein [Candidatus Aenigmarchaeota archaeon]
MAISAKSFSEMVKKDVFTSKGVYCGKITDVGLDMEKYRVKSVVIDAIRGSFLAQMVGDKRGVIIPFAMVQSIGDVVLIKHISPTAVETEEVITAQRAEQPTKK